MSDLSEERTCWIVLFKEGGYRVLFKEPPNSVKRDIDTFGTKKVVVRKKDME